MDPFPPELSSPICIVTENGCLSRWNSTFQALFPERNLDGLLLHDLFMNPEIKSLYPGLAAEKELQIQLGSTQQTFILAAYPLDSKSAKSFATLILFRKTFQDRKKSFLENFSVAAAAHDLANPISAIFGYADLLLESEALYSLSDSQQEIISRIRSTASRAIELVKNYQILAQLDHPSLPLPQGSSELNKIVSDVIDFSWLNDSSGPELSLLLHSTDLTISVPRFALERIAANLLNNARKYTPANGKVRVETFAENVEAVLSVQNYPSFIPETERAHIFEKFSRGNAVKDIPGTGLGLFIVKNLVDQANARIELCSSKEEGTTFTVHFPLQKLGR